LFAETQDSLALEEEGGWRRMAMKMMMIMKMLLIGDF